MNNVDVVVIGAGLCGLTAAYRLARSTDRQVLLVDASESVGGVIRSVRQDGYLIETGPHTFPSSGPAMMALCNELGLTPKPASPLAKNRYVYFRHQLESVPTNPLRFLKTPLLSTSAKLRMLTEPFQPVNPDADESVARFARRRLGEQVLDNLLGPFLSGVYAGDPELLSATAVFPKLVTWEKQSGSLVRGMLSARSSGRASRKAPLQLFSFESGMETLPNALAQQLPAGSLRLGTAVQEIEPEYPGYRLILASGEVVRTKVLVMATPAGVATKLLKPVHPELLRALQAIHYAPLEVLHLGFHRDQIPHALDGFGFLMSRNHSGPFLGSIWTSSLFPERAPKDHVLLTCFVGGAQSPEVVDWSTDDLMKTSLLALEEIFKQDHLLPSFSKRISYTQAIPQYNLGHVERVGQIQTILSDTPGLYLTGNYLHGVSLNDCVRESTAVADRIQQYLTQSVPYSTSS